MVVMQRCCNVQWCQIILVSSVAAGTRAEQSVQYINIVLLIRAAETHRNVQRSPAVSATLIYQMLLLGIA